MKLVTDGVNAPFSDERQWRDWFRTLARQVNTSGINASGSYTGTVSSGTNVSSFSPGPIMYSQTGSLVTVSGSMTITPTALGLSTTIKFTLPVASTFTLDGDAVGTVGGVVLPTFPSGCPLPYIHADVPSGKAELVFMAGSTTSQTLYFTFTYQIK